MISACKYMHNLPNSIYREHTIRQFLSHMMIKWVYLNSETIWILWKALYWTSITNSNMSRHIRQNICLMRLWSGCSDVLVRGMRILKGRNRNEKCIIFIQNGSYRGFGYIPYYLLKQPNPNFKNHIDYEVEHAYMHEILQQYFRSQNKMNIIQYKD